VNSCLLGLKESAYSFICTIVTLRFKVKRRYGVKGFVPGVVYPYDRKRSDLIMRKALRASRVAAGLTQRQLAERLHIHHTTVARIELGDIPNWLRYFPKIEAWFTACGCDVRITVTIHDQGRLPGKKGHRLQKSDCELLGIEPKKW
jgi:transcriptional regulator with XRE-family HTH domain